MIKVVATGYEKREKLATASMYIGAELERAMRGRKEGKACRADGKSTSMEWLP